MSDMSQPVEGAQTAPAPEAAPAAPAADPVMDRVNELAGTVGNLVSSFDQFAQRLPQPEPEPEHDPWAALYGDEPEPEYEPQPQASQLDPQALQAAVDAAIAQGNQPLLDRLNHMELERKTETLYSEIPTLRPLPENHPDHAAHNEVRQATHQLVVQSLQGYPEQIANQLAADPKYIATIFKAAEADKRAAGEAPANSAIPQQEAAGGALPGGNATPVNPVDQAYANRVTLPSGFGR